MNNLICQHSAEDGFGQACEHLITPAASEQKSRSQEHFQFFTGQGAEFVLLCPACGIREDKGVSTWRTICKDCLEAIAYGKRLGELGNVQVITEDMGLKLIHQPISISGPSANIVAAHPLDASAASTWLLLTNAGELMKLRFVESAWHFEYIASVAEFDQGEPVGLCISANGQFAGISRTYGSTGWIIDLGTGQITLELNRGTYYPEHCRFPLAFFEINGRHLLVHASDWNRLDISDPKDGKLLTERSPTSYRQGEPRPDHYLDYFHCGLSISPDNEWIMDNGWIWHPVGVIKTWSLKKWLEENVWESEDGSTIKDLCIRDYFWDGPVCWIDDRTVAVWGIGNDDLLLVPGIRLFDVTTGAETGSGIHPVRSYASTTIKVNDKNMPGRLPGTIMFDRWLFSWTPDGAFAVWNLERGTQLLADNNFRPLAYHRGSKEFLSKSSAGKLQISRIQEDK